MYIIASGLIKFIYIVKITEGPDKIVIGATVAAVCVVLCVVFGIVLCLYKKRKANQRLRVILHILSCSHIYLISGVKNNQSIKEVKILYHTFWR